MSTTTTDQPTLSQQQLETALAALAGQLVINGGQLRVHELEQVAQILGWRHGHELLDEVNEGHVFASDVREAAAALEQTAARIEGTA